MVCSTGQKSVVSPMLMSAVAFLVVGCGEPSTETSAAGSDKVPVCKVEEVVVHDDAWQTCGEILVFPDGTYRREVIDVWTGKHSATKHGSLPRALVNQLRDALNADQGFRDVDGVSTYRLGVDDTKTRHPGAVVALRENVSESRALESPAEPPDGSAAAGDSEGREE